MELFFTPSTSQYADYPIRVFMARFFLEGSHEKLRVILNDAGDWGEATSVEEFNADPYTMPELMVLRWWSPIEQKFYNGVVNIDTKKAEEIWNKQDDSDILSRFSHIVAGMAPYGGIAIWFRGYKKSVLFCSQKAQDIDVPEEAFKKLSSMAPAPEGVVLPPQDFFDNMMKQYTYRYIGLEEYFDGEKWQNFNKEDLYYDDLDFETIEDRRFDGTHDQLCDDGLLRYHEAGCPKRIKVKWHEGRNELSAHYWFESQIAPQAFCQFFVINANQKADILLRIDSRANRYEIALNTDTIAEPQVLPAESYQLLVFRNGHEHFRSENFNQEEGAWDW